MPGLSLRHIVLSGSGGDQLLRLLVCLLVIHHLHEHYDDNPSSRSARPFTQTHCPKWAFSVWLQLNSSQNTLSGHDSSDRPRAIAQELKTELWHRNHAKQSEKYFAIENTNTRMYPIQGRLTAYNPTFRSRHGRPTRLLWDHAQDDRDDHDQDHDHDHVLFFLCSCFFGNQRDSTILNQITHQKVFRKVQRKNGMHPFCAGQAGSKSNNSLFQMKRKKSSLNICSFNQLIELRHFMDPSLKAGKIFTESYWIASLYSTNMFLVSMTHVYIYDIHL